MQFYELQNTTAQRKGRKKSYSLCYLTAISISPSYTGTAISTASMRAHELVR